MFTIPLYSPGIIKMKGGMKTEMNQQDLAQTKEKYRKESEKMKLIAIDLDGTLLNNEGRLSERTIDVITKVREEGHKVIVATGRHLHGALPIASQLALTDALVCFNGALVYNLKNYTSDFALSYEKEDITNLVSLVKTWEYEYFTSTEDKFIIESNYERLLNQFISKGIPTNEVEDMLQLNTPILKTTIIGDMTQMDNIERYVPNTVPSLNVVRSGEGSIDIMSNEASKGRAVEWLANRFQISPADIITFGNYDNDISMLEYAGTGVAMDNAPAHVKKHADIITYSNEQDGVAQFLEENVLRKMLFRSYA